MRAMRSGIALAVYFFRPGPAFWRRKNYHRPTRPLDNFFLPRLFLYASNLLDGFIECFCESIMHRMWVVSLHDMWRPAVATKKRLKLFLRYTGENGWIRYLMAIEMEDWKNCPVVFRIEEFIGMPSSRQSTSFCFAIADDACGNKIWIVEHRPERMTERVPKLSSFVY